jgi:hypothetical protein
MPAIVVLSKAEALQFHRSSLQNKAGSSSIVRFDESDGVHTTYNRKDVSTEQAAELWFTRKEIKRISNRNKALASTCSTSSPRRHSIDMIEPYVNVNGTCYGNGNGNGAGAGKSSSSGKSSIDRSMSKNVYAGQLSESDPCPAAAADVSASDVTFSSCCHTMAEEEKVAAFHDDTCRGLECLINPFHRRVVRERKRHFRNTVMREQARQWDTCEISPMQLARIAREASTSAQTSAYIQGQLDAAEAGTGIRGVSHSRPQPQDHASCISSTRMPPSRGSPGLVKSTFCIAPSSGLIAKTNKMIQEPRRKESMLDLTDSRSHYNHKDQHFDQKVVQNLDSQKKRKSHLDKLWQRFKVTAPQAPSSDEDEDESPISTFTTTRGSCEPPSSSPTPRPSSMRRGSGELPRQPSELQPSFAVSA